MRAGKAKANRREGERERKKGKKIGHVKKKKGKISPKKEEKKKETKNQVNKATFIPVWMLAWWFLGF